MTKTVHDRANRLLGPIALVSAWTAVEDGHSLLADLLAVASLARSRSADIAGAVSSHPRLSEAFEEHPHLASTVEEHLPMLLDLLDAFDAYAASSSGQTH